MPDVEICAPEMLTIQQTSAANVFAGHQPAHISGHGICKQLPDKHIGNRSRS
jgi:hypothetical protein